jgi:hypothetical protein
MLKVESKLEWLKCKWLEVLEDSIKEIEEHDDDEAFEENLEALQALHYLEHLEKWLDKKRNASHGFSRMDAARTM